MKYNLQQIVSDARDIYAQYKGKRVKAYDGTFYDSFTWGNAMREAWAWAKEDAAEKQERITHEQKQAAILYQMRQLGLNRTQRHNIGWKEPQFRIQWQRDDFKACCGQRRKAKPNKSQRSKEVQRRERLAHTTKTVIYQS